MVRGCCVVNCPNKKSATCRSYPIPEINNALEKTTRLSIKRRKAWIKALRIINPITEILNKQRVCLNHFLKGQPARLIDEHDPDWVPSQNLGFGLNRICEKRKRGRPKGSFKVKNSKSNINSKKLEISENESFGDDGDTDDFDEPNLEFMPVASGPGVHSLTIKPQAITTNGSETISVMPIPQVTNLTLPDRQQHQINDELQRIKAELENKDAIIQNFIQREKESERKYRAIVFSHQHRLRDKTQEIKDLKLKLRIHDISFDTLKNDDEKVKNLTGLPNFTVLNKLFEVIKDDLTENAKTKFNKFNSFLITLMKLRLDLPISFLSFIFGETEIKISKMYRENLCTMNVKIGPLVKWPDDETLLMSTPNSLKEIMGNKCIVLIHFFEVKIKNIKSSHSIKHKLRYLIAFTPSAEIIYVSQGFGSSATNEHVIEKSGFLDKLSDQYIVLSVKDLFDESQKDNEQIQRIKHLAKNIEDKVLDLLRENFRILFNRQAVNVNKEVYSEYTVRCCCALANLQVPESSETIIMAGDEKEEATILVHTKKVTSNQDEIMID